MNIFVGNLAKEVTDDDLKNAFTEFGQVKSVKVIRDLFSGESKGFGFVEMASQEDGEKAIAELNGQEVSGREIKVNEAKPREDRGGRGGGGRSNYGGGGGYSGGGSNYGGGGYGGGSNRW